MTRFYHFLLVITLLGAIFHHAELARILASIPTPCYSHQVFYQRFWRELAGRGHEVVVMTTDPIGVNITTLREIDLSSSYDVYRPLIDQVIDADPSTTLKLSFQMYYETAKHQLALPQVRQLIDDPSEHFDLVIVEYLYPSFFALSHRFNATFIGVTSMDAMNSLHGLMGNSAHSVLFPHMLIADQVNMSFIERMRSFFVDRLLHMRGKEIAGQINELNAKFFGQNYPDYYELMQSLDMLFVNNNPLFSAVRPLSPSTISISGLHLQPLKSLPKVLQEFLDASSNGFVYFSMGSNVQSNRFSFNTLSILMETFRKLPFNVLWKFEDDHLPGKPENVKIMKWLPQQDVLRHKNIRLFVTQGGMQSLEEALFAHVPLIVIPLLFDQKGNAAKIVNKGVALQLDYKALSVEEFRKTILEVVNNPMYKENMKAIATQIQDQPMTSLERAVWWTEYLIRHKTGKHLRGPKIPLYQYFYMDIWAFLISCVLTALTIFYFLIVYTSLFCVRTIIAGYGV